MTIHLLHPIGLRQDNRKESVYLKTQNGRKSKTKIVCKYMIKNDKLFKK